ncbi:hypothetical protein ABE288_09650 [Bacillus salipaludis]|uniref:hypothetical protein n=1 Tax=Bacillus salipaludis TaxID=2547811 RepID=UPI003D203067
MLHKHEVYNVIKLHLADLERKAIKTLNQKETSSNRFLERETWFVKLIAWLF